MYQYMYSTKNIAWHIDGAGNAVATYVTIHFSMFFSFQIALSSTKPIITKFSNNWKNMYFQEVMWEKQITSKFYLYFSYNFILVYALN